MGAVDLKCIISALNLLRKQEFARKLERNAVNTFFLIPLPDLGTNAATSRGQIAFQGWLTREGMKQHPGQTDPYFKYARD